MTEKIKKKAKYNVGQTTSFMIKEAWGYRKSIVFFTILSSFLYLTLDMVNLFAAPAILGTIEQNKSLSTVLFTILFFTGMMVFLNTLNGYMDKNIMIGRTLLRADKILSSLVIKSCTVSYSKWLEKDFIDLKNKSNYSVDSDFSPAEHIWTTYEKLLTMIMRFIIYTMLLTYASPVLIIFVIVSSLVSYYFDKKIADYIDSFRDEKSSYITRLNYINGNLKTDRQIAKDIRIFSMKPWIESFHKKTLNGLKHIYLLIEKARTKSSVISITVTIMQNALAYFYLINLTLKNGLPTSTFLLYFSAISGFAALMEDVMKKFSELYEESMGISEIMELLNYKEDFKFDDGKTLEFKKDMPCDITLKNVYYRYPEAKDYTLKNINLHVKPGEKIAVVGLNGAGKSTLVKIICGFLDPTEGQVLLNGVDIKEYNRNDYYKLITSVFQDFLLLQFSVIDNICPNEENRDINKAWNALEKADLADKIRNLPNGIDTHVGRIIYEDGIEFSGGETQRLMLARAIYKDSPIMVLDEPTAALDPIAENNIYKSYNDIAKNKTSFFISHRLASTRFCDRILLLKDGEIAEEGTHESLINQNGIYTDLFNVQKKYYEDSKKGEKGGAENENN